MGSVEGTGDAQLTSRNIVDDCAIRSALGLEAQGVRVETFGFRWAGGPNNGLLTSALRCMPFARRRQHLANWQLFNAEIFRHYPVLTGDQSLELPARPERGKHRMPNSFAKENGCDASGNRDWEAA